MTLTMVMPSPIGRPKRPSRISPCWFDFCHHSWSVRSCRGHDVPHRTLGSLMGFSRLYAEFFLPINTQQFYQLFSMGMPCVSGTHDKYFSLCEPVSFAAARSAWSGIDVATTSKQHRRGRWSSWTKRSTHDNHLCCVICEADIITIHINTKNFRPWSQWVNLCVYMVIHNDVVEPSQTNARWARKCAYWSKPRNWPRGPVPQLGLPGSLCHAIEFLLIMIASILALSFRDVLHACCMRLANMEREDSPEDWLLELLTSHRSETCFAQVCFLVPTTTQPQIKLRVNIFTILFPSNISWDVRIMRLHFHGKKWCCWQW